VKLICLIIEELGWTARPNQIHQFHQSLLWEWRDWLRIDWIWRAAGPFAYWERRMNEQWSKAGWASHSLSAIQIKIIFIWAAERRNERSEPGLVAFSSLSFQFSKAIQSKTLIDCSWMKKRKEERPSPPSGAATTSTNQFKKSKLFWFIDWSWCVGLLAWAGQPAFIHQLHFIALIHSFYFYNKWNSIYQSNSIKFNLFYSLSLAGPLAPLAPFIKRNSFFLSL